MMRFTEVLSDWYNSQKKTHRCEIFGTCDTEYLHGQSICLERMRIEVGELSQGKVVVGGVKSK